jgi:hypothetical protein
MVFKEKPKRKNERKACTEKMEEASPLFTYCPILLKRPFGLLL